MTHIPTRNKEMVIDREEEKRVRIIVADDNKAMRKAIVSLLETNFDVIGEVSDGRALVDAVARLEPDIGVVDISMPLMNGIEAVTIIKGTGSSVKIIFLTVNEDPDFVRAAFDAEGSAYVVKRQMATHLPWAIDAVLAGRRFISPGCGLPMDV